MESDRIGKVTVRARVENLGDIHEVERRDRPEEKVRTVEVADALIDTGATMLSMPGRLIERLGLKQQRTRTARTAAGTVEFGIFQAVRLTVQGRDCVVEVAEIPDECPVLIG